MVGMARFERATPASRTQCPTKLGHIPTGASITNLEWVVYHYFWNHHESIYTEVNNRRRNGVIIYDLKCRDGHKFEGWFKDRVAFDEQQQQKLIACPVCGNRETVLIPSSAVVRGRDSQSAATASQNGEPPLKLFRAVQEYIHKNFDNVGEKFAEVALRIHHGEEEGRNIRGTATGSEEEALREEGVPFIKMPLPKFDG